MQWLYLLQIEGSSRECWDKLKEIAGNNNLNNKVLNSITDFYAKQETRPKTHSSEDIPHNNQQLEHKQNWGHILKGLDVSTSEDFATLIERFKSNQEKDDLRWGLRDLLKDCLTRLNGDSCWDFIDFLFRSDDANHYDVEAVLSSIPQSWKNKVSYQTKISGVIRRFGERYAQKLTNEYIFNSFIKSLSLSDTLTKELIAGIISGLAGGEEVADARQFFGFVFLVSSYISDTDATELTDYSLSRFELHLADDFGDGIWSDNLYVANDINTNIAGFIWSALGSPRAAIRWNAAHCVRKMADFNCDIIIDALVCWMKHEKVGAFGYYKFPFYYLHAKQYLLISFARISIENPSILNKHKKIFLECALFQHHLLIQKFASDVILNIEKSFPGSYEVDVLIAVKNVGKSNMPVQVEDYQYSTDSYWHKNGEVEVGINFHFAWDFDQYWHEPLGNVFGLPSKQIQDLAANLIDKEWGIKEKGGYNNDPRAILWDRSSNNQEIWHDHGRYPRTDNFDFYLSYHSMLVVAARLIEKMPVIKKIEWQDEDPWSYWLSRHLLTRTDGKWLADFRNPLPLNRPLWISGEKKDSWKSEITEEDFLNCLQIEEDGELWINVKGEWHEKENERKEAIFISTALVSPQTSGALLRALATCSDPRDYKLPNFYEEGMEIESGIFHLKGWINERYISKELDEFDPYAAEINYPPYSLGITIAEQMGLLSDSDGKTWQIIHSAENVLSCEIWSSPKERREEEPSQSGIRLKSKLSFLKQLCSRLGYDLIFEVGIEREIINRYDHERKECAEPQYKIFTLSADGELRTTGTNYQLG